jgi:hypothetical protein
MLVGDTLEKEYLAKKTKLIGEHICAGKLFYQLLGNQKAVKTENIWELKHLSTT